MTKHEAALRRAMVDKCLWMNAVGLNQGTSGNISLRLGERMLITPSATPYEAMTPAMIAAMPIAGGSGAQWDGPLKPSSEWRFHRDILRARPEVGAVVHTHSPYATALAIARQEIPPVHYMIAAFGGANIRCADYATFGTKALSEAALRALAGRNGCLLANHGMIAIGAELDQAMWLAVELETLARQYANALQIGAPVLLSEAEIAETAESFKTYGLRDERETLAKERRPTRAKARP